MRTEIFRFNHGQEAPAISHSDLFGRAVIAFGLAFALALALAFAPPPAIAGGGGGGGCGKVICSHSAETTGFAISLQNLLDACMRLPF